MMLKPAVDTSAVELMDTRQAADSLTQTHGAPEKKQYKNDFNFSTKKSCTTVYLDYSVEMPHAATSDCIFYGIID